MMDERRIDENEFGSRILSLSGDCRGSAYPYALADEDTADVIAQIKGLDIFSVYSGIHNSAVAGPRSHLLDAHSFKDAEVGCSHPDYGYTSHGKNPFLLLNFAPQVRLRH